LSGLFRRHHQIARAAPLPARHRQEARLASQGQAIARISSPFEINREF